jgi:hypothetical protein
LVYRYVERRREVANTSRDVSLRDGWIDAKRARRGRHELHQADGARLDRATTSYADSTAMIAQREDEIPAIRSP